METGALTIKIHSNSKGFHMVFMTYLCFPIGALDVHDCWLHFRWVRSLYPAYKEVIGNSIKSLAVFHVQAMNGHLEQDITEIIERDEAEAAQEIIPSLQHANCSTGNMGQILEESYQAGLPQSMSETFLTTVQPIMSTNSAELPKNSTAPVHVVSALGKSSWRWGV